jgi:hypothetical protein
MYQNRDLLMLSLSRFFCNSERVKRMLAIVSGSHRVSLRLIDWFITNYARRFNVMHTRTSDLGPQCINVYLSYRSQLRTYSKQQFDPFRRHERIEFEFEDVRFETTVGQLNFFRWAIENEILDYIEQNQVAIEASMMSAGNNNKGAFDGAVVNEVAPAAVGGSVVGGRPMSSSACHRSDPGRCKRGAAVVSTQQNEIRTVISFD